MISIRVNTSDGSQLQMIALSAIKRVVPDRNWTRIYCFDGQEFLVAESFATVSERINKSS
jgi:hypothetical protein